jgi:hypothetical protein
MVRKAMWADATVDRGTLTVPLTPGDMDWADAWNTVAADVERTEGWAPDAMELQPKGVEVQGVTEGSEAKVRKYIDARVQATEAELGRRRAETAQRETASIRHIEVQKEADARMTERFRELGTQDDA